MKITKKELNERLENLKIDKFSKVLDYTTSKLKNDSILHSYITIGYKIVKEHSFNIVELYFQNNELISIKGDIMLYKIKLLKELLK